MFDSLFSKGLFTCFYRPQTKLRKGNVFTPVTFCSQGGVCPVHAGIHPPGQTPRKSTSPLEALPGSTPTPHTPPTATAADGTHPTGMVSCLARVRFYRYCHRNNKQNVCVTHSVRYSQCHFCSNAEL